MSIRAEVESICRLIYEQCACTAEAGGSDVIAAQIRKQAGGLTVKEEGGLITVDAVTVMSLAPVKPDGTT